jgi:dihydrofolate reductase
LYRQAIASADCLRLTEIDGDYPGDAHFPEVSAELWREDSREGHVSAAGLAYAFVDYSRR